MRRCGWFDPLSPHLSDPLRALELQPYSLKPLLRRAMAYESLERYRKAYVDYKTVLQLDTGIQAAHDSVHRSAQLSYRNESCSLLEHLERMEAIYIIFPQYYNVISCIKQTFYFLFTIVQQKYTKKVRDILLLGECQNALQPLQVT